VRRIEGHYGEGAVCDCETLQEGKKELTRVSEHHPPHHTGNQELVEHVEKLLARKAMEAAIGQMKDNGRARAEAGALEAQRHAISRACRLGRSSRGFDRQRFERWSISH